MKWYWHKAGIHVKVGVYMNGALCGYLHFREEEFGQLLVKLNNIVEFIPD